MVFIVLIIRLFAGCSGGQTLAVRRQKRTCLLLVVKFSAERELKVHRAYKAQKINMYRSIVSSYIDR